MRQTTMKNPAAVMLGSLGGRSRSKRKVASSRRTVKLATAARKAAAARRRRDARKQTSE